VAIGLLLGQYPLLSALVVVVVAALLLEKLRDDGKISGDAALAMLLFGGLALAVILIGLGNGFNVDIFSYLFGSITTVQPVDLWVIAVIGLVVVISVILLSKELFYVAFDSEAAAVSGLPARFINRLLIVLTAVTVVLALRIVGILLIGALMVIPVLAAFQVARSFKQSLIISVVISLFSVAGGLFASYYLNLAPGGTVVLLTLVIFGLMRLLKRQ
jgi:zinc transport system permease protein